MEKEHSILGYQGFALFASSNTGLGACHYSMHQIAHWASATYQVIADVSLITNSATLRSIH